MRWELGMGCLLWAEAEAANWVALFWGGLGGAATVALKWLHFIVKYLT